MAFRKDSYYGFTCEALPQDAFQVVEFTGVEGLSVPYQFDVTLISSNPDIDMTEAVRSRATLTLHREEDDHVRFHGILASFEQTHAFHSAYYYRAVLRPALWRLALTEHNQVFLNMTVPDILKAVFKDGGLGNDDYELRLAGSYTPWEYVCQYQESHFDFASRWMEREGIYYFFEQGRDREKLVLADTASAHVQLAPGKRFVYSPPSGLDHASRLESVKSFACKQKMLPAKVKLKDYNYLKPSLELTAEAPVSERGMGQVYIYGEHFLNQAEGTRLARIRAQELKAGEKRFVGESLIPYLRPGYVFDLNGHFRDGFNSGYLTVELNHSGNQASLLPAVAGQGKGGLVEEPYYRNTFTAIPSDVQFRPERTTQRPRIAGAISAMVDAAGSGQYAELDDKGRYKIVLPFDLSQHPGGKASAWLRMAQPYAGADHGMHFPLHKGTEVLLTFIDGDPDRPVIASAVPNTETPSQVTDQSQTQCRLTTGGGNQLHFEDQGGQQSAKLASPTANTFIVLGSTSAGGEGQEGGSGGEGGEGGGGEGGGGEGGEGGEGEEAPSEHEIYNTGYKDIGNGFYLHSEASAKLELSQDLSFEVGGNSTTFVVGGEETIIGGAEVTVVAGYYDHSTMGLYTETRLGAAWEADLGPKSELNAGPHTEFKLEHFKIVNETMEMEAEKQHLAAQVNNLHTDVNNLGVNQSNLMGATQALAGTTSKLAGEVSQLAGQQNALCGTTSALAGQVTKLAGDVTEMGGAHSQMIGERSDMIGFSAKMTGQLSTVAGNTNTIAAESNHIAGLINQM